MFLLYSILKKKYPVKPLTTIGFGHIIQNMLSKHEVLLIQKLLTEGYSPAHIYRQTKRSLPTIYKIKRSLGTEDEKDKSSKSIKKIPKKLQEFESLLRKEIRHGVTNIQKLCNTLKKEGYTGSNSQVYRYVNSLPSKNKNVRFVTRYETGPGEQAQVDWGSFGKILISGREERLYAFVYILGYSRMKYVEFTIRQNLQTLENCHKNAFKKLGIPKSILYDNMKTVVIQRDYSDNLRPTYNQLFLDFAGHYGFQVALSHPYHPQDKGKVEATVKLVRHNFMDGMRFGRDFYTIDQLNSKVSLWLENEVHNKKHGTTGDTPFALFKKEEKYLRDYKEIPEYLTSSFIVRHSTKYCMLPYKKNFYRVPRAFALKELLVKESIYKGIPSLDIFFKDKLIKTYPLCIEQGKWIDDEDLFENTAPKKGKKKIKRKIKILKKSDVRDFTRPLSYYEKLLNI